jgi:SAM-dependent methyltransferase
VSVAPLRYDFTVDAAAENNTHAKVLKAVGRGKRVLDVGCATGYLSEFLLQARDCDVTCLEPDPAAAAVAAERLGSRVVVGGTELLPTFAPGSFDVVVYADVLEHVPDPAAALRETRRLLAPGGHVVVSLPNVAHGDVRMRLLSGHFPYQRTGLLDSTHIRFFTRHTIPTLFTRSGYWIADISAMTIPVGRTELGGDFSQVDPVILAAIHADPHAEDYQYVVRAEPDVWATRTRFVSRPGWQDSDLVRTWARAFSPAEPVQLALPVPDDDAALAGAVEVVEAQCAAASTSTDDIADIDVVRADGPLDLPDYVEVDGSWSVAQLRSAALPDCDVFLA